MYYQPTPIDFDGYHFLIMSAPDAQSMRKCSQVSKHTDCDTLIQGYESQ